MTPLTVAIMIEIIRSTNVNSRIDADTVRKNTDLSVPIDQTSKVATGTQSMSSMLTHAWLVTTDMFQAILGENANTKGGLMKSS